MNKLVLATVAAAVPTTAPALPTLPVAPANPHPDAGLFALIDQFVVAERKYREEQCLVDRMQDDQFPEPVTKMPDVLRWRRNDAKLGLPQPHVCKAWPKPMWDKTINVDRLRGEKWTRVAHTPIKGHPIKGMFQQEMSMVIPSKAARSRADEIILAFDEWKPVRALPQGFKKRKLELKRLQSASIELEDQVCGTRATTIDGMLAKARAAHANLWCKPDEIFEVSTDEISGCAESMAESIFRDLQEIAHAETHSRFRQSSALPG